MPAAITDPHYLDGVELPEVPAIAAGDRAGQLRNYRAGYSLGLDYRSGGNGPLKEPEPDPGLEAFFIRGKADGRVARKPQLADPELLAWWEAARQVPAWDWSKGPAWLS